MLPGVLVHALRFDHGAKQLAVAYWKFIAAAVACDHPALCPGVHERTFMFDRQKT